jgi:hypothetical protein
MSSQQEGWYYILNQSKAPQLIKDALKMQDYITILHET